MPQTFRNITVTARRAAKFSYDRNHSSSVGKKVEFRILKQFWNLESPGQKNYQLRFSGFRLFVVKLSFEI